MMDCKRHLLWSSLLPGKVRGIEMLRAKVREQECCEANWIV